MNTLLRRCFLLLNTVALVATAQDNAAPSARRIEGRLPSGSAYLFDVPHTWNGSVLLYSHGYAQGPANPARNVPRNERDVLLARGYALIGSSYASTGWALAEAVPDQLATLDAFVREVGTPKRTLAWGSSMGGLVTVALMERHPQRFDGGIALCASVAGTLGMMNAALDGAFVFKMLAAADRSLPLRFNARASDAAAVRAAWQREIDAAQATPTGRARIALAATLAHVPPWIDATLPRPPDSDSGAQQQQLYRGLLGGIGLPRDDQEQRAGGNFSWNTGIDYAALLKASGREAFVRSLYRQAEQDLDADLARLAQAPRISADPAAVAYMKTHYVPNGELRQPLLLMQAVADPVTMAELSGNYAALATQAGRGELVRATWTDRAGHCNFTLAETLTALQTLEQRIDRGQWDTAAATLNQAAAAQRQGASAFVDFQPAPLLRACSARAGGCPGAAP